MDGKLNQSQADAVATTEGYVRVVAGAGSGKTRTLTSRFAFLVNEMGALPGNILCVTFTNKAANEMRSRIHNLVGDEDTGYINTFHGFCVSVLQEDSHAVSYPKSFLVLDNSDIDSMLRVIYEERGLTLRDKTFSDARDMIEVQKLVERPDYYLDMIAMPLELLKRKYDEAQAVDDVIFYGYLYQEKKCFGLDYNDLIKFTLHIFDQNPEIRLKWQQRLEYVMVDEFQDIDALQYELMEVLVGYHKNLFIVGDPDQTIYTWRGANVGYLMNFDKRFPGTRTIELLENYRSTPQVIAAANSLISKNVNRMKKDLVPTLPSGQPVTFKFARNEEEEAKWIVAEMERLRKKGVPYKRMTVLYRAHYVTRAVEEALLEAKVPYRIYSGTPFFGRAEIKDALSYLRMVVMQDDLAFRRVVNQPKRNMGKRRMEFLEQYAEAHRCTLYEALKATLEDPVFKGTKAARFVRLIDSLADGCDERRTSDLLSEILNRSGYETMLRTEGSQERLDNLAELKQSVLDYERTCGEEATPFHYLTHVALFTNADVEDASDKVKLMTVHAAKGLEFPYVFLCGMDEGVFPSRKVRDLEGMEEERRLAFVAMTRAEEKLYLTGSQGRNFDGTPRYPSRFVMDIDRDLLECGEEFNDGLIKQTREYLAAKDARLARERERAAYGVGTRVKHQYLGEGSILEVDEDKGAYLVKFDNVGTPRKISFRVALEKL